MEPPPQVRRATGAESGRKHETDAASGNRIRGGWLRRPFPNVRFWKDIRSGNPAFMERMSDCRRNKDLLAFPLIESLG